jgi:RimJ/RimL family protein N-acetyltransferase
VASSAPPIAYRVLTPRLEIRCYAPSDAPALVEAMAAGVDHMRPWLPFARTEPETVEQKIELLRTFRGKFDLGQDFIVGAFDRAAPSQLLGGSGLHHRIGPDALEIGYWMRAGHTGRGLATETAAAMTRVAFTSHRVSRVEIRCDARNHASARVPEKLGYRREGCLRGTSLGAEPGPGDLLVFGMLRDEFDASPAAAVPVEAFDAAGRPIPG